MRRVRLLAVAGVSALALAACGDEKQDIFSPEGPYADKINRLQVPVFIVAGVVGVVVAVLLTLAIVSGIRRRKADDDEPVQLEGNFKLEIAWTILPAVLLAVISVFTVAHAAPARRRQGGEHRRHGDHRLRPAVVVVLRVRLRPRRRRTAPRSSPPTTS